MILVSSLNQFGANIVGYFGNGWCAAVVPIVVVVVFKADAVAAVTTLLVGEFTGELADHVVKLIEISGIDHLLKFGQISIFINLRKVKFICYNLHTKTTGGLFRLRYFFITDGSENWLKPQIKGQSHCILA